MTDHPLGPAGDLIAAIVAQNVDNLAFTTDRLIEGLEREKLQLAKAFFRLYASADNTLMIDRNLNDTLERLSPVYEQAVRIIETSHGKVSQ